MAYIPDLAPYDYYGGAPKAVAVGWLDADFPFASGHCPRDVRDRLAELCRRPVRLMRGFHFCQFCEATAEPPRLLRADTRLHEAPDVARGNGEVWLTDADGAHFVAPVLVLHYIDEHSYLPPASFVEAVRSGDVTVGID